MEPEQTCPRCSQLISPADTVEHDGDSVVHLDCRLPRRLSLQERALLFRYCWDHAVGECVACARTFRQAELHSSPFGAGTDRCAQCRKDLTDSMRAHLYSCAMLPAELRRRAQETRETAQKLVKQSGQICDRADVLLREAEVTLDALAAMSRQTALEALRGSIQRRLQDGSLPYFGTPSTFSGRTDRAKCDGCDQLITDTVVMLVAAEDVPHPGGPFVLHVGCFQVWNVERRTFKPGH